MKQGLAWLQSIVRPGQVDAVLIFLSGHGISDFVGQYWFPAYDFYRRHLQETCLSGETLEKELGGKLQAHAVFLFVDTCHAGGVERGRPEDLRFAIKDNRCLSAGFERRTLKALRALYSASKDGRLGPSRILTVRPSKAFVLHSGHVALRFGRWARLWRGRWYGRTSGCRESPNHCTKVG